MATKLIPVAHRGATVLYADSPNPDAKAYVKHRSDTEPKPVGVSVASVMARGYWRNVRSVEKHMGPGPHPSGSPQSVHGGGGDRVAPTLDDLAQLQSDVEQHATKDPGLGRLDDFGGWEGYEAAKQQWKDANPTVDFKYRKPEYADYPGWAAGKGVVDEDLWWSVGEPQMRADRAAWDVAVERAVTLGILDAETAHDIGWNESLGGENAWGPLPETLYHVTMAKDAVLESGRLKTREELAIESDEPGLGGGPSDTVSYTTDRGLALDMEEILREANSVARGEFTIDDMLKAAREGTGADGPYLWRIVSAYAGNTIDDYDWQNGEYPPNLQSLVDRQQFEWKYASAFTAENIPEGFKPVEATRIEGAKVDAWRAVSRPMTADEERAAAWEMYRMKFLSARHQAGGLDDPYIAHDNWQAVAAVDPAQITTFEFHSHPKTMGYRAGALAEWRAFSGVGVDLVGEVDTREGE